MSKRRDTRRETDRSVFNFLHSVIKESGIPPTLTEIGYGLGLSIPTVIKSLERLERQGYIYREPDKARAITLLKEAFPPFKATHEEVLDFIRQRIEGGRDAPTHSEIAQSFGFSLSTARTTVQKLVRMNLIEVKPHTIRGISLK